MGLVQRLTPPAQLNEGMTLAVTALLAGIAAGSATGGFAADHAPFAAFGYLVPAAAATLALLLTAGLRTATLTGTTVRDQGLSG
jgi:predicted MFS family arabinose efflux permease